MVQNYFETLVKVDERSDASSHILFAMSACLSDVDIQKAKFNELVKQ